jgi:RNA polymerase sigma factor (sigma-70 family)
VESLTAYLNDIGPIPQLTRDEEHELSNRIKNGDIEARNKLIAHNLKLVVHIAKEFRGHGYPLADLIQEGNIGLTIAADKYDSDIGKFSKYASFWIKQKIRRGIALNGGMLKIPPQAYAKIRKVIAATNALSELYNETPTVAQLAEATNLREIEVTIAQKYDSQFLSIDSVSDDSKKGYAGRTNHDTVLCSDGSHVHDIIINDDKNHMVKLLNELPERTKHVIVKQYGLDGSKPKYLREIAKDIDRTHQRVQQIGQIALKSMKKDLVLA